MQSNQGQPGDQITPLVVAVMEDLFFGIKVAEAAKKAGGRTVFVKTAEAFWQRMADNPALVVLDLNYRPMQPLSLIAELRESASTTPLVGYLPHVQEDLRREAVAAGCHRVLPRSAFATQVETIVQEAVRAHSRVRTA